MHNAEIAPIIGLIFYAEKYKCQLARKLGQSHMLWGGSGHWRLSMTSRPHASSVNQSAAEADAAASTTHNSGPFFLLPRCSGPEMVRPHRSKALPFFQRLRRLEVEMSYCRSRCNAL